MKILTLGFNIASVFLLWRILGVPDESCLLSIDDHANTKSQIRSRKMKGPMSVPSVMPIPCERIKQTYPIIF